MSDTAVAIIRTGGKQYRVSPGDRIRVEKLPHNPGDEIRLEDVLFFKDGDRVETGRPTVSGAAVVAEVIRQMKAKKVLVFKKRSKKGYEKLNGHRQNMTELLIKSLDTGSKKAEK
jgi:large subunit ribosomal protein L21